MRFHRSNAQSTVSVIGWRLNAARRRSLYASMLVFVFVLTPVVTALPRRPLPSNENPQRSISDVKVNRSGPAVQPAPLLPTFSAIPTDAELTRARVFEEPLIRVTNHLTHQVTRARIAPS